MQTSNHSVSLNDVVDIAVGCDNEKRGVGLIQNMF